MIESDAKPAARGSELVPGVGLVVLTLALGIWSWIRIDGTIFADVVEYLERAQAFVRGETVVDAQRIRAAGVTLLHAPALLLADLFGVDDSRWVLPYAAVVHLAVSCAFVLLTARLGRSLTERAGFSPHAARAAGLLAGLVAATSPTFVQFSAIAMTDIAAGAGLAYGFERALAPAGGSRASELRTGALAGVGFGLALLAAFKSLPLIALGGASALVAVALADGLGAALRRSAATFVVLVGFGLVQCTFDALTYGEFGSGLITYLLANFGPIAGTYLWNLGLTDAGAALYGVGARAMENPLLQGVSTDPADLSSVDSYSYYLDYVEWFTARWLAPIAALGVLAALAKAALGRPREPSTAGAPRPWRAPAGRIAIVLVVLLSGLAYAHLTSRKGDKDIRIWLPILPLFATFAGAGLAALAGPARAPFARQRAALVAALALGAVLHAPWRLSTYPPNQRAPLARAAAWLAGHEPAGLARTPTVACSFHWAVLFRTPPEWSLIKLPVQLDQLPHRPAAERASALAALAEVDVFLVHTGLLTRPVDPQDPWARELFDVVADNFTVEAAFWDRANDTGFGAILALRNRRLGGPVGPVLRNVEPRPEPRPDRLTLTRHFDDTVEQLGVTGLRVTRLAGDAGLFWGEVDVDVRSSAVMADYAVLTRLSRTDGSGGHSTVQGAGWGKLRTSELRSGARWTEGRLLAPGQGPLDLSAPASDLPAPDGPGQEAAFWWDLVTVDQAPDGQGHRGLRVTGRADEVTPAAERSTALGALRIGTFPANFDSGPGSEVLRLEGPLGDQ